jgi:Ca-activated chloride channel homolog
MRSDPSPPGKRGGGAYAVVTRAPPPWRAMSFAAPLFLLALLALPVLVLLYVRSERRRRARREALVSPALLAAVVPDRPGWRRHLPVVGYGLAATALVVGLARPQATVAVPVEQATVVVATDRSGSMLAEDVEPSRLVAARRAAETFLDAVPDDVRVGAVAFNHQPTVLRSPTRDHEVVRAALGTVKAAGSTATGDALASALELVKQARGQREGEASPAAIVLLSDGKSVRGRDALAVAEEARRAKVPVYTVALGTAGGTIQSEDENGARVTRDVPPDPATLRQVAERTGGKAFSIDDAEELGQVYERLGSELATEEREQEVTSAFAGGALLLVLVAVGGSVRWFGRVV